MSTLFLFTFAVYIFATISYQAYFWSKNEKIRKGSRLTLLIGVALHTLYIIHRYYRSGHTPITTNHEAVSFFAWCVAIGFLSFHWRYKVKNFGTFASILVTILMTISAFPLPK